MRRSTIVAGLGGIVAGAAGAWFVLVEGNIVSDKHVAGVPLARAALGAAVAGLVLLAGGLFLTRRQRKAEAALEDEFDEEEVGEYVWPTIVVRRHGRPRQRPPARIVTVPPSTWPVPSPRHPSMASADPTTTVTDRPSSSASDHWLPDNVQRLPFRS
jgi:hypothetical protein